MEWSIQLSADSPRRRRVGIRAPQGNAATIVLSSLRGLSSSKREYLSPGRSGQSGFGNSSTPTRRNTGASSVRSRWRVGLLLHLPNHELEQLDWIIFAEHLRPTTPRIHVLMDTPYLAIAQLVYEAVVVRIWSTIWKSGR